VVNSKLIEAWLGSVLDFETVTRRALHGARVTYISEQECEQNLAASRRDWAMTARGFKSEEMPFYSDF
jgi:hypothetical protein